MKKVLYILIVIGSFSIGWVGSYIYHEDLYHIALSKIERFQKDLEKDRWIIEQYYKEQRKKYVDTTKIDTTRTNISR